LAFRPQFFPAPRTIVSQLQDATRLFGGPLPASNITPTFLDTLDLSFEGAPRPISLWLAHAMISRIAIYHARPLEAWCPCLMLSATPSMLGPRLINIRPLTALRLYLQTHSSIDPPCLIPLYLACLNDMTLVRLDTWAGISFHQYSLEKLIGSLS
jgi:hypothetical protein